MLHGWFGSGLSLLRHGKASRTTRLGKAMMVAKGILPSKQHPRRQGSATSRKRRQNKPRRNGHFMQLSWILMPPRQPKMIQLVPIRATVPTLGVEPWLLPNSVSGTTASSQAFAPAVTIWLSDLKSSPRNHPRGLPSRLAQSRGRILAITRRVPRC